MGWKGMTQGPAEGYRELLENSIQHGFVGLKYIRLPPREEIMKFDELSISIVMPNWKRTCHIPSVFEVITSQGFPLDKLEIIFVDYGSTLEPPEDPVWEVMAGIREKYPDLNLRCFETGSNPTKAPNFAVNVGARRAKNEVLLINYTDGLQLGKFLTFVARCHAWRDDICLSPAMTNEEGTIYSYTVAKDIGGSIRLKHFLKIRGFDERFTGWGGHEGDLFSRLKMIGVHMVSDPDLKIAHLPDPPFIGAIAAPCNPNNNRFGDENYRTGDYMPNGENWGQIGTLREIDL